MSKEQREEIIALLIIKVGWCADELRKKSDKELTELYDRYLV